MTKEQLTVLEDLMKDQKFKGKKQLKHLIWLNTVEPKFKVGDCFLVTDLDHKIYGHPVKDFKGKIIGILSFRDYEEYRYELELVVECNGQKYTTKAYKDENELTTRCNGNVTVVGEKKSSVAECIDPRICI